MKDTRIVQHRIESVSNAVVRESGQMRNVVTRMATIETEAVELLAKAAAQRPAITSSITNQNKPNG